MPENIITGEQKDLEEKLMSVYECPICKKYICPPIRQCLEGHCFCIGCFSSLKKCPKCNAPKSDVRCDTIEKIHSLLNFPCKYQHRGCDFIGKSLDLISHQDKCGYSLYQCPLRFNNCTWTGKTSQIVKHCKQLHPYNIYFRATQRMLVSGFNKLMDRDYYILFNVFNRVFRCTWELDEKSKWMKFAVYCLGNPVPKNVSFSFEVSFLSGDTEHEIISMKGPCHYMEDDSEKFLERKYLLANYNMIIQYCDKTGDLHYRIKIIQN